MTNAINLKELRKSFGKKEVLSGLTLSIPHGTTFGLIGPNGAGKTTLFRIFAGAAVRNDMAGIRIPWVAEACSVYLSAHICR